MRLTLASLPRKRKTGAWLSLRVGSPGRTRWVASVRATPTLLANLRSVVRRAASDVATTPRPAPLESFSVRPSLAAVLKGSGRGPFRPGPPRHSHYQVLNPSTRQQASAVDISDEDGMLLSVMIRRTRIGSMSLSLTGPADLTGLRHICRAGI